MKLYACNLGAGGIDYRCADHFQEMLAFPANIEAGVTADDYELIEAGAGMFCEAC